MAIKARADGTSTSCGASLRVVAPSDSVRLPDGACRALYVGGTGDLSIIAVNDESPVTLKGVPAGSILPVRAAYVRATGTTATAIVALY